MLDLYNIIEKNGIRYTKWYGNLLAEELVGVVLPVAAVVALSNRVPSMDDAFTFKSPSIPFLVAPRSIERTLLSLTVELNFSAR